MFSPITPSAPSVARFHHNSGLKTRFSGQPQSTLSAIEMTNSRWVQRVIAERQQFVTRKIQAAKSHPAGLKLDTALVGLPDKLALELNEVVTRGLAQLSNPDEMMAVVEALARPVPGFDGNLAHTAIEGVLRDLTQIAIGKTPLRKDTTNNEMLRRKLNSVILDMVQGIHDEKEQGPGFHSLLRSRKLSGLRAVKTGLFWDTDTRQDMLRNTITQLAKGEDKTMATRAQEALHMLDTGRQITYIDPLWEPDPKQRVIEIG